MTSQLEKHGEKARNLMVVSMVALNHTLRRVDNPIRTMSPTTPSPSEGPASFSYASDLARLPLDPASPYIRLLTLQGTSKAEDPVSADIFVTSISTAPNFKALSYT